MKGMAQCCGVFVHLEDAVQARPMLQPAAPGTATMVWAGPCDPSGKQGMGRRTAKLGGPAQGYRPAAPLPLASWVLHRAGCLMTPPCPSLLWQCPNAAEALAAFPDVSDIATLIEGEAGQRRRLPLQLPAELSSMPGSTGGACAEQCLSQPLRASELDASSPMPMSLLCQASTCCPMACPPTRLSSCPTTRQSPSWWQWWPPSWAAR